MTRPRFILLAFFLTILTTVFSQESTTINYRQVGLSCYVDCSVNDFPVEFTFDTGAELISIPQKLATLMEGQGALYPADFTGEKIDVRSANGSTTKGKAVVFREVKLGDMTFRNVGGVVMPSDSAGVLLGQTVLSELSSYTVDNERKQITLIRRAGNEVSMEIDCDSLSEALTMEDYIRLGIKAPSSFWSERDYDRALGILEKLQKKCQTKLPRKSSMETGELFEKLNKQPDLMAILHRQSTSEGGQVALNNSITNNFTRMYKLYDEAKGFYVVEQFEMYGQQLYFFEEMGALIKRLKNNPEVLPPADLELLKDGLEHGLNGVMDILVFGEFMLQKEQVGELAGKLAQMMPSTIKEIRRSKFKSVVREQAWVLSQISNNETVQFEMTKLYDELKPSNQDKKDLKAREALGEKLKENQSFANACLAYDGKFLLTDDESSLEYRLNEFDPKIKIILTTDKDGQRNLSGKAGRRQSKIYNTTNKGLLSYLDSLDLVVRELVGAN